MKKFLAAALCALLLVPVLAGCGLSVRLGGVRLTGPGTRYDVNDSAEFDTAGVESIRISAVSDDIIVKSGGEKVLAELRGECRGTSRPVWLDARREGSEIVVEVKYPSVITSSDTELTVTIPAEYAGGLKASSVSGGVEAGGLPFRLGRVELNTVSGRIGFGCESFESMKANTISGNVALSGIRAQTDVQTTSGDVSLDYGAFAETSVRTVSGGVEASVPQGDAFSVEFGSVSGDFTSTHSAISVDRADRGFQGSANGGGQLLKVGTTSGGFVLKGK